MMTRTRTVLILLGLMVMLATGILLGLALPKVLKLVAPQQHLLNTTSVVRQIQTLSQLVTVKYVVEKVIVLEDVKWYGENKVLIIAQGVVKGGVDLSKINSENLQIKEKAIHITLPKPEIMDAYLDEGKTQILERSTGLLRKFDKDLEQVARVQAIDDIRRAARLNGILKDAKDRAANQLKQLFTQLGFEKIEIQ